MFVSQESWASDVGMVRDYMCSYLKESSNEASDPSFQLDEVGGPTQGPHRDLPSHHQALTSLFLLPQFLTYLFSKENMVMDAKYERVVPEEMNHPLSQYWISSSHNT